MRRALLVILILFMSVLMISCSTVTIDTGNEAVILGQYKGITYNADLTEEEQKTGIMRKVIENAQLNKDLSGETEQYIKEQNENMKYIAETYYGMSAGELLAATYGLSEDEYTDYSYESAYQCILQQYVLAAVIEKESITLSEEEYRDSASEYLNKYNFKSIEELEEIAGGRSIIEESLLYLKAQDFIFDMAVAED